VEAAEFLRNLDMFKQLKEEELERLALHLKLLSLPVGLIIKDNDAPDGLYIIKTGMAKVTKTSADTAGIEALLTILRPGNSFGELSLIDGQPRSASVSAISPSSAYFLPRDVFLSTLRDSPELAMGLLQALTGMVRSEIDSLQDALLVSG
jgi:CRP/FNR family transcriptional regulator/CRP/FNR family cyclic AMP-dependent transcriptional regulator